MSMVEDAGDCVGVVRGPKYDVHVFQMAMQLVRDAAKELDALPPGMRDGVRPLIHTAVKEAYDRCPRDYKAGEIRAELLSNSLAWKSSYCRLERNISLCPSTDRLKILPIAMKAVMGMVEACNAIYRPRWPIMHAGSDSDWVTDRESLSEYVDWFRELPEIARK